MDHTVTDSPDATTFVKSPAAYSKELIPGLRELIMRACVDLRQRHGRTRFRIYDPMAGNGARLEAMLAELFFGLDWKFELFGSEIEREFIACPWITHQSMFDEERQFDIVIVSPAYGNRMSDQYLGTPAEQVRRQVDGTKPRRTSYAISLGRRLTVGSGAALQWGPGYRDFHTKAWTHVRDHNLVDGGHFILNAKSHYRNGGLCDVSGWHKDTCLQLGLTLVEERAVACPGNRDGQNRDERLETEEIYLFTSTKETR